MMMLTVVMFGSDEPLCGPGEPEDAIRGIVDHTGKESCH